MKIFDISVPLRKKMPYWPGAQALSLQTSHRGYIAESHLSMGLHTGTHIDGAHHFIPGGKKIDEYPIDRFIGTARVISIDSTETVTCEELKKANLEDVSMVLFKTCNSASWGRAEFHPGFVGLEPRAAYYLVECGISLVGIDYLSIQGFASDDDTVHQILLGNDVLILEGINLAGVPDDDYLLMCCPLMIEGAEASPVRALLLSDSPVAGEPI